MGFAWLLVVDVLLGLVRVQSTTACPSAEEVSAALRALVGESVESPDAPTAAISEEEGGYCLELRSPAGAVLLRHHFDGTAPCDTRTLTAAAVIAAWTGELRSATVPAPRPIAVTVATARPAPRVRFEVGAQFLGALSGTSFAPGARAHAVLAPRSGRWAGRLSVSGTDNRTVALGQGSVAWTRVAAGLGPLVRFAPRRFTIDLSAELLFALLRTEGRGFPRNTVAYGFDPGLSAGVQAGVRIGSALPFVAVSVAGWPRPQSVRVTALTTVAEIPRIEAWFATGVAFGTF